MTPCHAAARPTAVGWQDDSMPPETQSLSACADLVRVTSALGALNLRSKYFLRVLALLCGGIRPGPLGLYDLAVAGANLYPGQGFRPEFDDGTAGQVRHFVGIAASVTWVGVPATRFVSEQIRRDLADSPDGRLGEVAIRFAHLILTGALPTDRAAEWLETQLCGTGMLQPEGTAQRRSRVALAIRRMHTRFGGAEAPGTNGRN